MSSRIAFRRNKSNQGWCIADSIRAHFVDSFRTGLVRNVEFVHEAQPMRCVAGYNSTGEAIGILEERDTAIEDDLRTRIRVDRRGLRHAHRSRWRGLISAARRQLRAGRVRRRGQDLPRRRRREQGGDGLGLPSPFGERTCRGRVEEGFAIASRLAQINNGGDQFESPDSVRAFFLPKLSLQPFFILTDKKIRSLLWLREESF